MGKAASLFRKMTGVSSAIFLSRVLGFFREILTAHFLGAGVLTSAWNFAFMVPNLARRVFGEGLLVQVLVPVLTQSLEKEGKEAARDKFFCIFFYLTFLLSAITVIVSLLTFPARFFAEEGSHWDLALKLIPIVMPYCIFICLVGIMTSFLNTLKSFVVPTFISLLLNLSMIGCFLWIFPFLQKPFSMLEALGYAVVLSGILELLLMFILLKKKGVFPTWNPLILKDFSTLRQIFFLILPGLFGACGYEISVICDRSMAMLVGPHALPALTFSERLAYLPVGVIAVAFGTVTLPDMAKHFLHEEYTQLQELLSRALHILLYLTIPLAFFILLFHEELVQLCFMRGKFSLEDSLITSRVLMIYAAGIPAFCTVKLLVNFFLARKDTRTPMYISLSCIGVNILLNFLLYKPLGERGLALATVISAYLNNILLLVRIRKSSPLRLGKDLAIFSARILKLSLIPAGAVCFLCTLYFPGDMLPTLQNNLSAIGCGGALFGTLYILSSFFLCKKELRAVLGKLLRR